MSPGKGYMLGALAVAVLLLVRTAPVSAQSQDWLARYNGTFGGGQDCPTPRFTGRYVVPGGGGSTIVALPLCNNPQELLQVDTLFPPTFDLDVVVGKFAPDGSMLWLRRYGTAVRTLAGVAVDPAGDVYVLVGTALRGARASAWTQSLLTLKYAGADGQLLWQAHEPDWVAVPRGLAVATDGSVAVTGVVRYDEGIESSNHDVVTVKYNRDGRRLWWALLSGSSPADDAPVLRKAAGADVAVDGAGRVYVGAIVSADPFGSLYVVRATCYGDDGRRIWQADRPTESFWLHHEVRLSLDQAGSLYIAAPGQGTSLLLMRRATADGALVFAREIAAPRFTAALTLDGHGGLYVLSAAYALIDRSPISLTRCSASDGTLLWRELVRTPNAFRVPAFAVAVDARGDAYVAGSYEPFDPLTWTEPIAPIPRHNWAAWKYAADDGRLLWNRRDAGPGRLSDVAVGVIVEADGVRVGGVYSTPQGEAVRLVEYARDGQERWATERVAAVGSAEAAPALCDYCREEPRTCPNCLAVLASGGTVTVGKAASGSHEHGFIVKHDAAGRRVWARTVEARLRAVAVDAAGAAYVAGDVANYVDAAPRLLISKFAADGTRLWTARSGDNVFSTALDIRLDAAGHALVTALFRQGQGASFFKHHAADGHLLATQTQVFDPYHVSDIGVDLRDSTLYVATTGGLWKYNASGQSLWTAPVSASKLVQDPVGDVYAFSGDFPWSSSIAKVSQGDGHTLWASDGCPPGIPSRAMAADGNAVYLACGGDAAAPASIRKLASADGHELWRALLPVSGTLDRWITDIALDTNGDVFAAYQTNTSFGGYSTVRRYAGLNGRLLSSADYSAAAGTYSSPLALEGDGTGSVHVAIATTEPVTGHDVVVAKYGDGPPNADITLTLDDGRSRVAPRETTTYTLTVLNRGPAESAEVQVQASLPSQCAWVSWGCAAPAGAICATAGSGTLTDTATAPVGVPVTYRIDCRLPSTATGLLTATASATATVVDPSPDDNSARDESVVAMPSADAMPSVRGTR